MAEEGFKEWKEALMELFGSNLLGSNCGKGDEEEKIRKSGTFVECAGLGSTGGTI